LYLVVESLALGRQALEPTNEEIRGTHEDLELQDCAVWRYAQPSAGCCSC
jgi:hypothetical protein